MISYFRTKEEETSLAIIEFKKKCEKKVAQIKDKFKLEQTAKDEVWSIF